MAIKRPTNEEIFAKLDFAFDGLDSQRARGLQRLKSLHSIRSDGATREKKRLKAKYGTEHPRVKKLEERLTYNAGAAKELDAEIERTKITQPSFDINTWMVHGRVLNKEGKGISGLTVSLYDEKGTWIEQLGYACTDERGYFAIRYKADQEKGSEIPEDQKLILTLTDAKSKVLHRETEPLFVKIGQIVFRLIVLEDKGDVCTPPEPDWDHATAIPPDAWLVRGGVTDQNNQPAKGMVISLYDKDLLFDDVLGTTLTNDDGRFKIIYRTEAFRDLFEAKPDLYLKVLDNRGNTLFRSEKQIRVEAGRVEDFQINIKTKE